MDLRQLEYVVAVVDHGGFTRAAAALHVSQPSLSQGVRTLEAELGIELFHRLGRTVVLSAAGEALIEPARQVLRDVQTARASVAAVAGLTGGYLDVVALPTLAAEPLARLIGAFRRLHSEIVVRVAEPEDTDALAQLIRSGRSEVGLTEIDRDGGPTDLVAEPLLEQDVLAVLPPGTRTRSAKRLLVSELEGMRLITAPPGTSTRRLIDQALSSARISPRVAVETGQREAIVPLVLAGAGTSFLPRPMALEAARQGAVVAALDPPLVRTIGLLFRRGPLSPAGAAFCVLAREQI